MLNDIKCGDAYELIKDIPSNSVDLIITDPPYDFIKTHGSDYVSGGGCFGTDKRKYHVQLNNNNIVGGFDLSILEEFDRVLKKVNIYIWCNKNQLSDLLKHYENKGMFIEVLTWHKTNPIPTCHNKYLSDTEYLVFAREKGVKIYGTYSTKRKYYVTPINSYDKKLYKHPTIKPLEIIKNLVINSSQEGEVVLDPFMGSGTTAVACKELGRDFIGIELNKEYVEIAKERLKGVEEK